MTDYAIQPSNAAPSIDTSTWPLLLKVKCSFLYGPLQNGLHISFAIEHSKVSLLKECSLE